MAASAKCCNSTATGNARKWLIFQYLRRRLSYRLALNPGRPIGWAMGNGATHR